MNLVLRLIYTLIMAISRKRLGILEKSRLVFWVLPNDLDFNGHMNNGRYHTLMDLGRIDALVRFGVLKKARKDKWKPVVASSFFRYIKGLRPWQTYTLETRFICWDSKFFYIEQKFIREGKTYGVGLIKGLFVANGKSVPSAELLNASNYRGSDVEVPKWIEALNQAEKELLKRDLIERSMDKEGKTEL